MTTSEQSATQYLVRLIRAKRTTAKRINRPLLWATTEPRMPSTVPDLPPPDVRRIGGI